ncbi:hypothetical protein LXL04_000520 [Taraxacum kok-saghyz]
MGGLELAIRICVSCIRVRHEFTRHEFAKHERNTDQIRVTRDTTRIDMALTVVLVQVRTIIKFENGGTNLDRYKSHFEWKHVICRWTKWYSRQKYSFSCMMTNSYFGIDDVHLKTFANQSCAIT